MGWRVQIVAEDDLAVEAAAAIASFLPGTESFLITGGTTAERVYPHLAESFDGWAKTEIYFSDERCVPPDDAASNYAMAKRTLLDAAMPRRVHRMHGEEDPEVAAARYHDALVRPVETENGFDLAMLGLGADCHVAGLFPGSPVLDRRDPRYAAAVRRPDGMAGISLTPPALASAAQIVLVVSGGGKADALRRVLNTDESDQTCPARVLAEHDRVLVVGDEPAAAYL